MDKVERKEAETMVEQIPSDIPDDVKQAYQVTDDVVYGGNVGQTLCLAVQITTLFH